MSSDDPVPLPVPTGPAAGVDPAAHAAADPAADAAADPDAWLRIDRVFAWLLAGTLVVPTAVAVVDPSTQVARGPLLLLVTAVLVWHAALIERVTLADDDRITWLTAAYWAVVGPGAVVLAGWADAYAVVLYGLFPVLLGTLGWWGIPGVAAVTTAISWQQGLWDEGAWGLVNVAVSTALATLVGVAIHVISRQSAQRRDALAALAATRAELAAVARRTGALEERERLAREIHDTVAQDLISVITHLQAAEGALALAPGPGSAEGPAGAAARGDGAARHVAAAGDAARSGLAEVRRAVRALRPDLLEAGGLVEALERVAASWSTRTGILARFTATGAADLRLHPDREVALLRAAQEALANAARHARATTVDVELAVEGDVVRLRVTDDGIGLPGAPPAAGAELPDGVPSNGAGTGFGLRAMAERVGAVGGSLTLGSGPAGGTAVAVEVPA